MAKISRRQRNSRVQNTNHEFSVAPLTKAVRVALAVSVSALALTMAPQQARASNPGAPWCNYNVVTNTETCNGYGYWYQDTLTPSTPVHDLTMVVGNSSTFGIAPFWWWQDGIAGTWDGNITVELGITGVIDVNYGDGIYVNTGDGWEGGSSGHYDNATVINRGDIYTNGVTGINVYAYGVATVDNYHRVQSDTNGWAEGIGIGIGIVAYDGNATVRNHSGATVDVNAFANAFGVRAESQYQDTSVTNDGLIDVFSRYDSGWGIDIEGDSASATNTGTINVDARDFATGIEARGDGNSSTITNSVTGHIDAHSNLYDAWGIHASTDNGSLVVTNRGTIEAYSNDRNAVGVEVSGTGGVVTVLNRGNISADGIFVATGIDANVSDGSRVTINNGGSIAVQSYLGVATGIAVNALGDGLATVTNGATGEIDVRSYYADAIGIHVDHGDLGDVEVHNDGAIAVIAYSNLSDATGIIVQADGGTAHITNSGTISASAVDGAEGGFADHATGIFANLYNGSDLVIENTGDVLADSWYGDAYGVRANVQSGGTSIVHNHGSIVAHSDDADAIGVSIDAKYDGSEIGGSVDFVNTGDVTADTLLGNAYGVWLAGPDVTADNQGSVAAFAPTDNGQAFGIVARGVSAVTFSNSGSVDVEADGGEGNPTAVFGEAVAVGLIAGGDIVANNFGQVYSTTHSGDALGIGGLSYFGDISIVNTAAATVDVDAGWLAGGRGIGIGAYTEIGGDIYGNISIENAGLVTVRAEDYATGLFGLSRKYGNIVITNSGTVTTLSADVATGIRAVGEKYGDVDVTNGGLIDVTAYNQATGIVAYAREGSITVVNAESGVIDVQSLDGGATGINASSFGGADYVPGDVFVDNAGQIAASTVQFVDHEGWYTGLDAIGIDARSDGGQVDVDNSGSIDASAFAVYEGHWYYGDNADATGIAAMSWGDGTVTVTNTGHIGAEAYYHATGINVEGQDGNVSVTNDVGGSIHVLQTGWDGDAADYGAYGIRAYTAGTADIQVDNAGSIAVNAEYSAYGIYAWAEEGGDVTVRNLATGTISASSNDAAAYGIGAWADGEGNATVYNAGAISAEADIDTWDLGAMGIQSWAYTGDVLVTSSGSIDSSNSGWAEGIGAKTTGGDVTVSSSGSITVDSADRWASGIHAEAERQQVYVDGGEYNGYTVQRGWVNYASGDVSVTNATGGKINVTGHDDVDGIYAHATGSDVLVVNDGLIDVSSETSSGTGIVAEADATYTDNGWYYDTDLNVHDLGGTWNIGNVHVDTGADSNIDVLAWSYAVGIDAYAQGGDVTIHNAGDMSVVSRLSDARGISAQSESIDDFLGGNVSVTNAGDLYVATVSYNDDTDTSYEGGSAFGIVASSEGGNVSVGNSGTIEAVAFYNYDGDWYYGDGADATGIDASTVGDGTIGVTNTGRIDASAYYHAAGINASGEDGNVLIGNADGAEILVTQMGAGTWENYSANGIFAYTDGAGDIQVDNAGLIDVWGEFRAYGVHAWAEDGADITANNFDTGVIDVYSDVNHAYGISVWADLGGSLAVHNAGAIDVENDAIWYGAAGIHAEAERGDVFVTHSGDITVNSHGWAEGIVAVTDALIDGSEGLAGGGDISVGTAAGSTITVTSSGSVSSDAVGIRIATNAGAVTASNAGDIQALAPNGSASGIFVGAFDGYEDRGGYWSGGFYHNLGWIDHGSGDVSVINSATGSIAARSEEEARGIDVRAYGGDVTLLDNGSIEAYSEDSAGHGIAVNAFAIYADNGGYEFAGLFGTKYHDNYGQWTVAGDITITTGADSTIDVESWTAAWGIDASSQGGAVTVVNDGDMSVFSHTESAFGIQAESSSIGGLVGGNVGVGNYGHIYVTTGDYVDGEGWYDGHEVVGIDASSAGGDVKVVNTGTIGAIGYQYDDVLEDYGASDDAYGIRAYSNGGDVLVSTTGHIDAIAYYTSYGIAAAAVNGDVTVTNSSTGVIHTWQIGGYECDSECAYSAGIMATTEGDGDVTVRNAGEIRASAYGHGAGIYAEVHGAGNVTVMSYSTADISVHAFDGAAYGISAVTNYGNAFVRNDGAVDGELDSGLDVGIDVYSQWHAAYGIRAEAWGTSGDVTVGEVTVINTGDITSESGYEDAFGVLAMGSGDLEVHNAGSIAATADFGHAYGIKADTDGFAGDVLVTNADGATIVASTYLDHGYQAFGIEALGDEGSVTVGNAGAITASAYNYAFGIDAVSVDGDVTVTSAGTGALSVTTGGFDPGSEEGAAYGIRAVAKGLGDVIVDNGGSISVHGAYYAYGIYADTHDGDIEVINREHGVIHVEAGAAGSYGISAWADTGYVKVGNEGLIEAYAVTDVAKGIDALSYDGDVAVWNYETGHIDAYSEEADATGIHARSTSGNLQATNYGIVHAWSYADATGIEVASEDGQAVALNSGYVGVDASLWATGIAARSFAGSAAAVNEMEGVVKVWADRDATGLAAYSVDRSAHALNFGDVEAHGGDGGEFFGAATGIRGYSRYGDVTVANFSSVDYDTGEVLHEATIDVGSLGGSSTGMSGIAENGGHVHAFNTGTINVSATDPVVSVAAIGFSPLGKIDYGNAIGIQAYASDFYSEAESTLYIGGVYAANYGSVSVTGDELALGITARTQGGDIMVINGGDASIDVSGGTDAYGINAVTLAGYVGVDNYGAVTVDAAGNASGIHVDGGEASGGESPFDIQITNESDGTIDVTAEGTASGVYAAGWGTDIGVFNDGVVTVVGGSATGLGALSGYGVVVVVSHGEVDVAGEVDANGIWAHSMDGETVAVNAGIISAHATEGDAVGIDAYSEFNSTHVMNSVNGAGPRALESEDGAVATITAYSELGDATGIYAGSGEGYVEVTSDGEITVSSGSAAYGIQAISGANDASVYHTGSIVTAVSGDSSATYGIHAGAGDTAYVGVGADATIDTSATSTGVYAGAAGVSVLGSLGAVLVNSGSIRASGTGGTETRVATAAVIAESEFGDIHVENSGLISATASGEDATAAGLILRGLKDVFVVNTSTGTITAAGDSRSVAIFSRGPSDEEIVNLGTITGAIVTNAGQASLLNDGTWNALQASDFGAGDDRIHNYADGVIVMNDSAIMMGDWGSLEAGAGGGMQGINPSGNEFVNDGTIVVRGDSLIDMGVDNPNAFVNNGTIDFFDGHPDDTLTIAGDLAGDGVLLVDLTGLNGDSDVLYVEGNVREGTTMHIAGHLDTMPTAATTRFDILRVAGDSAEGQLVLDSMTTNDDSFVTFQIGTDETLNSGNTAPDLHSLVIEITGLSPRGDALSTLAPAMQNYWHDSVGSLTRRTGVAEGQELGVPTAWVRVLQSDETVKPDTGGRNFGPGGTSEFDQSNTGMEFGVDVGITDTLRLGVLASKGDASVTAKGVGRAKINVDSYGAYVTWLADNGFYVDATYRKMDFSTEVKADGFKDKPDASADGYSMEAGYAWKLESGLVLKPEFQYSSMKVSKFDVTDNSYGTFDLKDGDSTRLRAGLTVQKTLGEKGKTWTPYGGAYFVDEMDGKGTFGINSDFQGDVDIGGNSVLIEGGVTGQIGNWVLSGGLHWQDGGAISSALGGQLSVRYSF